MSIEGRKDNRSFNLPNTPTQKIISGNSVPVKGTGAAFGTTNKDRQTAGGDYYMESALVSGAWRLAVSNTPSTTGVGLTTDPTKSGVVSDTSGLPAYALIIKF